MRTARMKSAASPTQLASSAGRHGHESLSSSAGRGPNSVSSMMKALLRASLIPAGAILLAGCSGSAPSPASGGQSGSSSAGSAGSSGAASAGTSAGAGAGAGGNSAGQAPTGGTSPGGATDAGGLSGGGGGGVGGSPPSAEKFSFFVTSLKAIRRLSGNDDGFGGDLRYGESGDGAGLKGADKI